MYYVYLHRRASDLKPFYIGKGNGKRAYAFNKRSKYWKRVADKHGVIVEVLAHWEKEDDAFEHEKFLIDVFRNLGHELANISPGGDGRGGFKRTKENVEKMRLIWSTQEMREKARARVSGDLHPNYGKKFSDELRKKLSEAQKNNKSRCMKVICIETGELFESSIQAANWVKQNSVPTATGPYISAAANGKFKTAYGFTWGRP